MLLHLPLKLSAELPDPAGMKKVVLQASQNSYLDVAPLDRLAVLAGARIARRGTALAAITDHAVARPTAAALKQTGQKVARAACAFGLRCGRGLHALDETVFADRTLSCPHLSPETVVDYP